MMKLFNQLSKMTFLPRPARTLTLAAHLTIAVFCLQAAAAQPAKFERHTAVSELGSIRDRLSRHEDSLGAGWGLDWSRRISPAYPKGNVASQPQVSSASNSYGAVPSASTTSLLYSRPRRKPAVQRRFLQGYRQSLNPFILPNKRPSQAMKLGRFETSPSSSTSNGDNLPDFSYHLNKVATHRRRTESLVPVETVYDTKMDDTPIISSDDVLFAPENAQPNPGTEKVGGVVEVLQEEGLDYPDIIVKSTLDLAPAVQSDVSSISNYLPLHSDTLGQGPELAHLDESVNDVETDEEHPVFRNYRGEGISYQQILLDNAIDLGKLMERKEKENMIGQHLPEEEDTGKSFSNFAPTQSRRVQLIPDSSVNPVIEDDHKVIYLKMVKPDTTSRLKGTKLKEVLEGNDEDLLDESSFESYLSSDTKDKSDAPELKLGLSGPVFGFDLIENQIAAVNRIGDVASSESKENTQEIVNQLIPGGPRARQNEKSSQRSNVTSLKASQNLADDQSIPDVKQRLTNFGDVEQRSNSPVNQNKQLVDYYPQPQPEAFDQDSAAAGSGYNQEVVQGSGASGSGSATSPSRPFKQRYPGWANVEPYQYSQQDPETGAYKFGYGDQYQWRHEERRADGVAFGGYGWMDETGRQHIIRFVADRLGYRVLPRDQEIDFSKIPVYPPLKETEDSQSPGGSSQGYNKIDFVTPKPLRPTDFGGYPGVPASSTEAPGVPDFNVPQVHPPVAYPGSILQLLGSNPGSQSRPLNASAVSGIVGRPGIALTFNNNSVESSTIPSSILESLLNDQAKQSYQGRSQKDDSEHSGQDEGSPLSGKPEDPSSGENPDTLAQFASPVELVRQNDSSSELRPPFNTASNSIAVPTSFRDSVKESDPQ